MSFLQPSRYGAGHWQPALRSPVPVTTWQFARASSAANVPAWPHELPYTAETSLLHAQRWGHTCCECLLVNSIHLWRLIHLNLRLIPYSRPACSWCLPGRYPAVHCICGVCSWLISSCTVQGLH